MKGIIEDFALGCVIVILVVVVWVLPPKLDRIIELQEQQVCCDPAANPDDCSAPCCGGK